MTRRRRSEVRRRGFLAVVKADSVVTPTRLKWLLPAMAEELDAELTVLDLLEQDVYAALQAAGVPSDLWEFYMSFTKRLWKARVKFTGATYITERTSLYEEFDMRGLDPTILAQLQPLAEARALQKRAL